MVSLWVMRVKLGLSTIEDVPAIYKERVLTELAKEGL